MQLLKEENNLKVHNSLAGISLIRTKQVNSWPY